MEILKRLENGESGLFLTKVYWVGKATILDIKKKKDDILNFASKLDCDDGSKQRKKNKNSK